MSLEQLCEMVGNESFQQTFGRVKQVRRDAVRVMLPHVRVGALCMVKSAGQNVPLEIVSLDPSGHTAMPLDDLGSIQLGDPVYLVSDEATIPVGDEMLGRVVDSMCHPYDDKPMNLKHKALLYGGKLNPMDRQIITEPIDLGVRAINACLTCGKGQRQGIFAGSGVGKSVLLGMIARYTSADVVVISLLGERGREVREFIERDLGPEGLKRSIVVVETAEKSAVRRVRGAFVATAIAEHFRAQGKQVLLMMDSLTRFAMAAREIGIAAGEPPTTKGYTPSVFSNIARLVERAGNWGAEGSITGLYTVLVEGDDLDDPVADNTRAILDGHIVLSRQLANKGQYPAIDLLTSISRVMDSIVSKNQMREARLVKQWLSKFKENEDGIQYGMYVKGSDPLIDECIEREPHVRSLLAQEREDSSNFSDSVRFLERIVNYEEAT